MIERNLLQFEKKKLKILHFPFLFPYLYVHIVIEEEVFGFKSDRSHC